VLALLLVALSVGLDNLGASTAIGVSGVEGRLRLRIALIFGTFEAVMPIIGLLLGRKAASSLGGDAKIVAGVIIGLIGLYTIVSEVLDRGESTGRSESLTLGRLIFIGATLSIDNLVIGFALGDYRVSIPVAAVVIAGVSVALTLLGLELGARMGERLGRRAELVSGVMLIGIGVAIGAGLL
jgi:manganese efflux pump family protein